MGCLRVIDIYKAGIPSAAVSNGVRICIRPHRLHTALGVSRYNIGLGTFPETSFGGYEVHIIANARRNPPMQELAWQAYLMKEGRWLPKSS